MAGLCLESRDRALAVYDHRDVQRIATNHFICTKGKLYKKKIKEKGGLNFLKKRKQLLSK